MRLTKEIGHGAENTCYLSDHKTVVKFPHLFGQLWQIQTPEHLERCIHTLEDFGIQAIQTTVLRNCTAVMPDKTIEQKPFGLEVAYIKDIEDEKIGFSDMLDPSRGPKIIKEILEILKKAAKMYEKEKLGLDLLGGPIYGQLLESFHQKILAEISNFLPEFVQQKIRKSVTGVDIKMDNLIDHDGELQISDIGLWDLSKDGKFVFLMETFLHVIVEALIKILSSANDNLPTDKRLPNSEFQNINIGAGTIEKFVAKKLAATVLPLLFLNHQKKESGNYGAREVQLQAA